MALGLVPCPSYYSHVLHVVAAVLCPSCDLYRPFFQDDDNDCLLCPSSFLSLLDGDEMMVHSAKNLLLVLLHRDQIHRLPSLLYLVHQDGPSYRCLSLRLCPCLGFDA